VTAGPSRFRKVVFGLAAAALAGLITFAALEVVCRLIDPVGISYYPQTARWLDTMIVREPIGYWNRPGVTGTFFGAPVTINSIGLRGPEIPPKAPHEIRVLLMGDSFPFGIGVSDESCLPATLQARLQAQAAPDTTYRVVNMGVVSYNTEQELRQLQELGLGLKPDLVVLAFAVNDIEPVMWVFEKRRGAIVNVAQRSYAASLLAFVARNVKFKLFGYSGIAVGDFREDSPRWRKVDQGLTKMHALCRDAGVPFVVFYYDDLVPPKRLVQAVGGREGFPVLDLGPEMTSKLAGRNPAELRNSPVDSHPNVEGNRVWAEVLFAALDRERLLPHGSRDGS